jgi:transcriptional regulator GlxA family with amidase domain
MQIAALVFDKITLLDIVGPMELLTWLPDAEVKWVGVAKGPIRAAAPGLGLTVDHSLDEVTAPDILVVPGGPGVRPLTQVPAVLDWVRQVHATTTWTTSVCTGALLFGAAGLLQGLEATTHWAAAPALEGFGATYTERRVVPQGKIVTSAGVSSGIDMALWLLGQVVGDEAAEAAQLCIEYDPEPPYHAGAPSKASEAVMARARAALAAALEREHAA